MSNKELVREAFSRESEKFDRFSENSPVVRWMRSQVYGHLEKYLKQGDHILELNAGTGIDAFYLASKGYRVHATDISLGMLALLKKKKLNQSYSGSVTVQECSFTDLDKVEAGPYDYIFSNFGGLNCVEDLGRVGADIPKLLKPGGRLSWVIMPKYCPWEWLYVFKGNARRAFRRARSGAVKAHIEGVLFDAYYHNPTAVVKALGKHFQMVDLQALALFCPPPYLDRIAISYPSFFHLVKKMDTLLGRLPGLRSLGDHYIITFEYSP